MNTEDKSNEGSKRKRRISSPHANEFHSHTLKDIGNPEKEEEINDLAKRYARLKRRAALAPSRDSARIVLLREKLVSKAMKFFYVTGTNVQRRDDGILHEGHYAQVDEQFIDTLLKCMDSYDPTKGLFTHMLRNKYGYMKKDAAIKAALEDTRYGGGEDGALSSLDEKMWRQEDSSVTAADMIGTDSFADDLSPTSFYQSGEGADLDSREDEDLGDTAIDADLTRFASEDAYSSSQLGAMRSDLVDELFLAKILSLIAEFMGKSGKEANETRKLYTKMFFSETLTSMVKSRGKEELDGFCRQQKGLFNAVELPFQDTYTRVMCRTIIELWETGFVDGIPPVSDEFWRLPATVFISYLKSIGKSASNALVSQQRGNYKALLAQLKSSKQS